MKILVACEFSGVVRDAFIKKGHNAVSCDLLPTETAGPHIQGDVIDILGDGWNMMIAHPPCTFLCVPGAHYLHTRFGRWNALGKAVGFFNQLMNAPIHKICVENPLPHRYAKLPKYSQIINPWMFGKNVRKRTCLWLKNLPKLIASDIVDKGERYYRKDGSTSNSKWYAKANAKKRATTFKVIADAMANQWG